MNEKEEMNAFDLANMLCASISAKMEIKIQNDKIEVTGGTALRIVDMYIICKALEVVAGGCLPMMESADAMKDCLKRIIDLMDFDGVMTEEDTQ